MFSGFSHSFISTCFFVLATSIWHETTNAASVQLTWADNSRDANGFDIERKVGTTGEFLVVATVPPSQKSYTDTNLSKGTTYCYRVRAFNSIGGSPYSNEACMAAPASTSVGGPDANTISTNISNGAVLNGASVIWTAFPSGAPVRVEFFINGTLAATELYFPYQFNGDPSGTLDTNALANGSHELKVRATYTDGSTAECTVGVTVLNTRRGRRT